MKTAQLIHNPGAGDEEHEKEDLISMIEANGFECRYSSTKKKDLKELDPETDFLIIAGGDGTIRKVTKVLMERKAIDKTWPIGLLPLGTANNIAKTLDLHGDTEILIKTWHQEKLQTFDVGKICEFEEAPFFLESFGFGIFPYLMQQMKKKGDETIGEPEEKIRAALKMLHEIIHEYDVKYCHLIIDGTDHSGKYILAEIMNTKSMGPNLFLAPNADPGDGILNVVLIPEADKEKFSAYVLNKLNNKEENYDFVELKGKKISIAWDGTHVHIDDEVIKLKKKTEMTVEVREGLLRFLVP